MNKVILSGRLTRNLEVKDIGATKIGKFSLAVRKEYKNQKGEYESDFFNCVIFNASDYVTQRLQKGVAVLIDGRLQTRTYEKDGENRTITEIVINKVEILTQKTEKNEFERASIKTEVQEQFDYDDDFEF